MTAHHCSLFDSTHDATGTATGPISMADLDAIPDLWRQVLAAPHPAVLGRRGSRMLVVAAQPLLPVARAFAALREERQWGATDALPADEPRIWRDWQSVLAVSRLGDEPELHHALRHLPPQVTRLAVTAGRDSVLAPLVDELIALPENSPATSASWETALLVAARAALGEDVTDLADSAEAVLASNMPESVPRVRHVAIVGAGWAVPVAALAGHALTGCRSLRVDWHAPRDVRYGALDGADRDSLIWVMGSIRHDVIDRISATGAIVTVTGRDPLVDYVAIQRMARELSPREESPTPLS